MAHGGSAQELAPGAIAEHLFCLEPDRDERAPQLCAETLLTLAANQYLAPSGDLASPKRQLFALRSLATGKNFLGGRQDGHAADEQTTPEQYGAMLARGSDIRGSANLGKAQLALQGLIDPDTQRAQQPGAWLLRPFHESLLWYDARKPSPSRREYTVRKVYMRGSGITFARILLDPRPEDARASAQAAVLAIREALTAPTPVAEISRKLEGALPIGQAYNRPPSLEDDERAAWERGSDPRLDDLARALCKHAEGVMTQEGSSAPARLWQLRSVLALDLACHTLRTAWNVTNTPVGERYLLLSFSSAPRATDPVRKKSEDSYRIARIKLSDAIVRTLASRMQELAQRLPRVDWATHFQTGSTLGNTGDPDSISNQLRSLGNRADIESYLQVARNAVEVADYSRGAENGFRVLLESVGCLVGTGIYRYLTASPDLLATLVGALSQDMPMTSREFFAAVRREWGLIINQESASATSLAKELDGAGLEYNARRAEKLMGDAGLAVGLSDRTTLVGERVARETNK